MNLSEQYMSEGGLVKIPNNLKKLVIGGAKTVVMGQVIASIESVIKQYTSLLNAMDSKHENYNDIEKIVNTLKKYVSSFNLKSRKSNIRKKKILISSDDMKPYDVDDFTILLTTSTNSKKITAGSIKTDIGNNGFHKEIPLEVNFSSIAGTIDLFKSFASKAPTLHMLMRDRPLDDMSLKMLKNVFPEFKKFTKEIRIKLQSAISILTHELTHIVQFQTGQGFNHSDLNAEGGYIEYKGNKSFDKYSVGSKEIKAYLVNQVDSFYAKDFTGISFNDAVKSFVSDRVWFNAFKDSKKRNKVIRDFTIAISKDRRRKRFKLSEVLDYSYSVTYSLKEHNA